jgi:hypothetical protein
MAGLLACASSQILIAFPVSQWLIVIKPLIAYSCGGSFGFKPNSLDASSFLENRHRAITEFGF